MWLDKLLQVSQLLHQHSYEALLTAVIYKWYTFHTRVLNTIINCCRILTGRYDTDTMLSVDDIAQYKC